MNQHPPIEPRSLQDGLRAGRPLRVLVADDEPDAVQTLAAILRQEGHQLCLAYDGAEVLYEAERFCPDVVLLDIRMPRLDGYDAARALKRRYPGIVLVAITAWKAGSDKAFARVAGFEHHFGKPYQPRAVVELLSQIKSERCA